AKTGGGGYPLLRQRLHVQISKSNPLVERLGANPLIPPVSPVVIEIHTHPADPVARNSSPHGDDGVAGPGRHRRHYRQPRPHLLHYPPQRPVDVLPGRRWLHALLRRPQPQHLAGVIHIAHRQLRIAKNLNKLLPNPEDSPERRESTPPAADWSSRRSSPFPPVPHASPRSGPPETARLRASPARASARRSRCPAAVASYALPDLSPSPRSPHKASRWPPRRTRSASLPATPGLPHPD